jgi:hypothetical protein
MLFISLLFICLVHADVCVCERERGREREGFDA